MGENAYPAREQPLQWRPNEKTTEFSWFVCYICGQKGRGEGHTLPDFRTGTALAHHLATQHNWSLLRAMKLAHDLERDRQEFIQSELQRASVGMRPRINIPWVDWTIA